MRDAFGGIVNIVVIVVFLVIVSGYMAYTVNYTKAFRVKNKIISTFEQYDVACETNNVESNCNKVISDYMSQVGYQQEARSASDLPKISGADKDWQCNDLGYCWVSFTKSKSSATDDTPTVKYYKISTWVNMDIPLINRFMPTIFQVQGDTKAIQLDD